MTVLLSFMTLGTVRYPLGPGSKLPPGTDSSSDLAAVPHDLRIDLIIDLPHASVISPQIARICLVS